jgi:parallel beta-helix repeat protein
MLVVFSGNAKTYYVSNSGNDLNSGTSENSAWRSLRKVNSFSPKPGDQILFKRGDQWIGTIAINVSGTPGSPITYGAYGTGAMPKIYGSEIISDWTLHSGNIYKAKVNSRVTQLFVNGLKMKVARYPNSGYHTITSVQNSLQFTSNALNGNIDYTGAKWFGRTNDWTAVTRTVTASNYKTLTFDARVEFDLGAGEGFILMNKLEFLDTPAEWFYDSNTSTVYLWTPQGDSPDNYEIRGSVFENGIVVGSNKDYITIRELEILEQSKKGIWMANNKGVVIKNTFLLNQDQYGLYCYYNSNNCSVINNYTSGQNARGIFFVSSDSDVSDNQVENIGLFDNIGVNSTDETLFGVGIDVYGNSPGSENTVRYNRIKNTGYTGLYFRGKSFVEYNYITHTCLVKDDGGGIYTPSATSYDSKIRYNIVLNSIGSNEGLPKERRNANGIYLDEPTGNILVEFNTVAYCNGGGIFLHYNGGSKVSNNLSFGNRYGLLASREWDVNIFMNNIVYSLNKSDEAEEHQILARSHNGAGRVIYDNNIYIHPYNSDTPFKRTSMPESSYYDFEEWKEITRQDANSTIDLTPLAAGETEQLIYNDSKQPRTYNLGSTIYRDIYGKDISGEITLEPFTSIILIGKDFSSFNQYPIISDQLFNITSPVLFNDTIGNLMAFDPDSGQVLTYKIFSEIETDWLTIDSITGTIYASEYFQTSHDVFLNLLVQVTDNAINSLSDSAYVTIHITGVDMIPPEITSFGIPPVAFDLTVPVDFFTATDDVIVAGYKLTESSEIPIVNEDSWSIQPPAVHTFSSEGKHTLFAWTKDSAGNISEPFADTVFILFPDLSPTFSAYLFEEESGNNIFDSHGSNDGILLNEVSRVEGASGMGLEFNGSGFVSLKQSFGEIVRNEISLSVWIKPDTNSYGFQGIIMHGGPNIDTYALYINPDTKTIGFKTSGTTSAWFAADNVEKLWDGSWHHLVVVYNGTEKMIFLDNKLIAAIHASGKIDVGYGYNLLFGAGRDEIVPTLMYYGKLDDVRIYNYALSFNEIGELFHPVNRELNKIEIIEDITICKGEEYQGWTQAGQYERVLQRISSSASGADSIITTNLYVNQIFNLTENVTIYAGENYNGWTDSGTYIRNFKSAQGCDSTITTNLFVEGGSTQNIELVKGWNLFSSYLIPNNKNMEVLMEKLRNSGELVMIQDETDQTYEELYTTEPWINNIGNLQITEGYKILVNTSTFLEIKGRKIDLPLEIDLKKGANIISFPMDISMDAMQVFKPLIDEGVIEKVQNEIGNSIEYWNTIGWWNGIGDLLPGEGYIVRLSESGTLKFDSVPEKSNQIAVVNSKPIFFNVDYSGNGFAHMNININGLNESGLEVGDEIAVYDGKYCVGAIQLSEWNFKIDAVSIPASASDRILGIGFYEGNPIDFRIWRKLTNEVADFTPFVIQGELKFGKYSSIFVSFKNFDNLSESFEIYPNPAQNFIVIEIPILPQEGVKVLFLDATGKELMSRVIYSNSEKLNIENLPAGLYLVKAYVKNRLITHKLVIS